MRIVIAEDEPRSRRGMISVIESVSEKEEIVGEAFNGKKALELVLALKPDVLITDIRMPLMDGIELIKACKSYELKTKCVIVSAYEEFDYAKQAIALGVVDYLVKPIMVDDVQKLLNKLEAISAPVFVPDNGELCQKYPDSHPLVLKSFRIIEQSYSTKISQKDIADSLGITAEYFSYIFAKSTGMNFAKFLKTYRIEKAIEFLRKDKSKKNDIPYEVGFSDSKYFFKCFKEVTGECVSEYIQKHLY